MEFEDKQTSPSPETAPDAGDSTQFLQSMGFGEEELRSLGTDSENEAEEEVALSSQPDDMEIPGADSKKSSTPRVVGVQIGNTAHRVESDGRIEISPTRVAQEVDTIPEADGRGEFAEEAEEELPLESDTNLLHLHCPSCDGELVLQEEHVGVEGACVWCDIKIVAARAGLEGMVKVFSLEPIQAKEPKKEKVEMILQETPADAAAEFDPVSESPDSEALPAETGDSIESEDFSSDPADEIAQDVPVSDEENDGFSSPWETASESESSEEAKPENPEVSVDTDPVQEDWSGMSSMDAAAPVETEVAESSATLDDILESDPETEPASAEPASVPDSGFSAWGEVPDAFESDAGDNEQVSESPIEETKAEEMTPAAGFGDMDFTPNDEAKSIASEGDGMPDGFGSSPFSGDSAPSPLSEQTPAPSDGFDAAPQPIGFESPEEEPLEALFGSKPESNEPEAQEANSETSSSAFEGFGSPGPAPGTPSEPAWEGTIGSSENPSIELAPLPVPEEPFSSPVEMEVSADAFGAPAAGPADSGFGLPESTSLAGDPFSSAPSEEAFSQEAGGEKKEASGFSNQESAGFADPAPTENTAPSPVSDLEDGFGSLPVEDQVGSSPDGFQIPAQEGGAFGMNDSVAVDPESVANPFGSDAAPALSASDAPAYADPFASSPESKAIGGAPDQDSPFFTDSADAFSSPQEASTSQTESLFSENPLTSAPETEPPAPASSEAAQTGAVQNPFGDAATPPIPGAEAAQGPQPTKEAKTFTGEEKSKPKRKGPRKGLVVLLVVLIGFVCGAALASFVLPVDQYIVKARAMMEAKFNPGGAILNQDLLTQPTSDSDPQS